ncbi:hypothetical protein [Microbispora rosea]|uniref:hypothetical protein n=1 Tax=Microbispora rosea TaxID=58117 RepID=UPI00117C3AB9|nr:hypothetical protein [Microbispora rosea]GIH51604.1 hypothetical protein Mro03_67830 [Microbispora rosea subsp. rosea]
MNNDRKRSAQPDSDDDSSFRRLVDAYRGDWVVRRQPWLSATRRRQLPFGVLRKSDLAMTIEASDLADLARQLEEQTRLANDHVGKE